MFAQSFAADKSFHRVKERKGYELLRAVSHFRNFNASFGLVIDSTGNVWVQRYFRLICTEPSITVSKVELSIQHGYVEQ